MARPSSVDAILAAFPAAQRRALDATRAAIAAALPGAREGVSWQMCTFRVGSDAEGKGGDIVISVMGFARHNSLFPGSATVAAELGNALSGYETTKGTIHFERDRPFPRPLLTRILRLRIAEINASYPRASGLSRQYFDNGRLKAEGRIRGGELAGAWRWWRRDGSLMRAGEFKAGEQVGTWTTYDRTGTPVKVTHFTTGRGTRSAP